MKRTIFISILSLLSFDVFAQQHDVMVVEKADKTTTRLSVENIKHVTFEPLNITVTTGNASNITENSVTITGTIEVADLTVKAGVLYGETSNLSIIDGEKKQKNSSSGFFFIVLSDLAVETTYYYCLYVEFAGQYYYGETKSFVTPNHSWVDLGLSVKWATLNVGSSSPGYGGRFFAWGETDLGETTFGSFKNYYNWSNYKYSDVYGEALTKYNTRSDRYGSIVDHKKVLDLEDDAAHVNWGGAWRMPTYDEANELITKCKWEEGKFQGQYGFWVTGPNGNTIFIPDTGAISGYPDNLGGFSSASGSLFWINELSNNNPHYAQYVYYSSSSSKAGTWSTDRCKGLNIRAVCP